MRLRITWFPAHPGRIPGIVKLLALALLTSALLTACVQIPGTSQSYRYEIDMSVDGRPFMFRQYFVCYEVANLSEADGAFHRATGGYGSGITTADVGDGLVLLFTAGGCSAKQKDLPRVASLLVNRPGLAKLYTVDETLKEPPVVIRHVTVEAVQNTERDPGPTAQQVALKNSLREHQGGFQRVTARRIPREVWATSDEIRAYFRQFKSVTAAMVGEGRPVIGNPADAVWFRFWRERAYERGPGGEIAHLKTIELPYDSQEFELQGRLPESPGVWYATPQTSGDRPNPYLKPDFAVVNYKGTLIKLKSLQEIFDPETQEIVQLSAQYRGYPWGDPDEIDVKRMMSSRK